MPITLSKKPNEKGAIVITASFKNEDGQSVTPKSVNYTLTDEDGEVINSRQDVTVTPASSVDIVLSGDDLAVPNPNKTKRIITIKATYDSTYGTDLPMNEEGIFYIKNLTNVS